MSTDRPNDRRRDAKLRKISLPSGLIERIRAMVWDDETIDDTLREFPIPTGMIGRIQTLILTDEELDLAMRCVPTPQFLNDWVRCTVFNDEGLDELLRDVPLPNRLAQRSNPRHLRNRLPRLTTMTRWATRTATSMVICVSLLALVAGFLEGRKYYLAAIAPKPAPVESIGDVWASHDTKIGPDLLDLEENWRKTIDQTPWDALVERSHSVSSTSLAETRRMFVDRSVDPMQDVGNSLWGVFGADPHQDDLPELQRVSNFKPKGIDWPVVSGSNRSFLMRYGVHPFVSPAAHEQFRTLIVPLTIASSSYDAMLRTLAERELPPPDSIRTEEFLAAMDYGFERPRREDLRLVVHAALEPAGGNGMSILQIGVRAKDANDLSHPPQHCIMVVDRSTSMGWSDQLLALSKAMTPLMHRFFAEDRFSLILFNDKPFVVFENASAKDAAQAFAELRNQATVGSTNVGEALAQAFAVADRVHAEDDLPTQVILITDGISEPEPEARTRLVRFIREQAAKNIGFDVIQLGPEETEQTLLKELAGAGGGTLRYTTRVRRTRWTIQECILKRSLKVASDVQLSISFNPAAVGAYRLFGHESSATAGTPPEQPITDFYSGQTSSALFETQLLTNAENEVATVKLTWKTPDKKESRNTSFTLTRSHFVPDFKKAAPSVQVAYLAARIAEWLRDAPFIHLPPHTGELSEVRDLAERMRPMLSENASYFDLLSILSNMEQAKPYRGGAK